MKDGKNTKAKKKTTNRPNTSTKPKITKVDTHKEEIFVEDVEESDNRLIVFIAIAILVIVGTIIALVVGCEKKKEPEPEKPTDDIVIPVKPDEEDNKGVETKEVVRKVAAVYKGKKTKPKDTVQETEYNITYYLYNEETEEFEQETNLAAKEGSALESYVPEGYSSCTYYADENMSTELDMTQGATKDAEVYMTCSLITYNISYEPTSSNPSTYTVKDADTSLVAPDGEGQFDGWYTDSEYTNKVDTLNILIIDYADENNNITLYGKYVTETEGDSDDDSLVPTTDETPTTGVLTTALPEDTLSEDEEGTCVENCENDDSEENLTLTTETPSGSVTLSETDALDNAKDEEGTCVDNCDDENITKEETPSLIVNDDENKLPEEVNKNIEGTDDTTKPEEGNEITIEGGNVTEEVTPAPAKEAEPESTPPVTPAPVSTPAPANKVTETHEEESEVVTEVIEGETE